MLSAYSKNSPSSYPDKSFMHMQGTMIAQGTSYYGQWYASHIAVDGNWHGLYHLENDSDFTIMFWAKYAGNPIIVLSEKGGMEFGIKNDFFRFIIYDDDGTPDEIYIKSHDMSNDAVRWRHYAFTWDNSGGGDSADDMTLYIDGKDVSTTRFTDAGFGTNGDDNQSIFHGAIHPGGGAAGGSLSSIMKDPISDFVMYDKALSQSDIRAIISKRDGFNHRDWKNHDDIFLWIDYADTNTISGDTRPWADGGRSTLASRRDSAGNSIGTVADTGLGTTGGGYATRFLRGPTTK
jgi:hypothetical protein